MIENPHDLRVIRIALLIAIEQNERPDGNKNALPWYRETLHKVRRLEERWAQRPSARQPNKRR